MSAKRKAKCLRGDFLIPPKRARLERRNEVLLLMNKLLAIFWILSETNEMHFSGKLRDSTPPTSDYILLMLRLIRVTKAGKCFLVYNIFLDYSAPLRMRLISAWSWLLSPRRRTSGSASAWFGSGLLIQSVDVKVIKLLSVYTAGCIIGG